MLQFSYLPDNNYSLGINQNDSPASLPIGTVEDAVNMDIRGTSLVKRKGFEKLAGDIPVSVISFSCDAGTAIITLPTDIDLDQLDDSSPIWLFGRIYNGSAYKDIDFRASGFTSLSTFDITAGDGTLNLDVAEDLGAADYKTIIQAFNYVTGEHILLDDMTVNPSTGAIDISYSSPESFSVQFIVHTCDETYSSPAYGVSGELSMDVSESISAATHQLSNLLIPMFWEMESATSYVRVYPNRFAISPAGDVSITFNPETPGKVYQTFLTACEDYVDGTAVPGDVSTTQIIAAAENRNLIAACYVEDPVTAVMTLVMPNSIVYDEANNQHAITFLHDGLGDFTNYRIIYAYGSVASNRMQITSLVDTNGDAVDTGGLAVPATLAITGLNNELLESPPYVNYVDNYEQDDETLAAAGGNIFRTYDPSISEVYDTRARIAATQTVAPTFAHLANGRTNGCLICTDASPTGYLDALSVTHVSGNLFDVLVSAPSYALSSGTLSSVIPVDTSVLTLTGSIKAKLNGDHIIKTVSSVDGDHLLFRVEIESATSRDAEAESGAIAGIFSDTLTFQAEALFLPDAILTLSSTADCEVLSVDTITPELVYIKSVEEVTSLYLGQRIGATLETSQLLLNALTELVAGDMVTVNGTTTRVTSVADGTTSAVITLREAVDTSLSQFTITCPLRWQVILPGDQFLGEFTVSATEPLRSVAGKGSMYFSSGIKYDGNKIYSSGLPKLQIHSAINVDESSTGKIAIKYKTATITSIAAGLAAVSSDDIRVFKVLDKVVLRDTTGGVTTCNARNIYTVTGVDTSLNKYTFDIPLPASVGGHTYTLDSFVTYKYYARLALLDRNGNLAVSASLGSSDLKVRLSRSSAVHISGVVLPLGIDPIDYSNLVVEIFRRREDETTPKIYDWYRLTSISVQESSGYFTFTDTTIDEVAEDDNNRDEISDPLGGIGSTRMRAPSSAAFLTAINNQLVAGSFSGENKAKIRVTGSAAYSAFRTKEFTVTTASGDVDYYVCNAIKQAITGVTGSVGVSFTLAVTTTSGITAGDTILVTRAVGGGLTGKPTFIGWWTVESVGATSIVVLWSEAPATADILTSETTGLVLYHEAGKVPLVHDLAYAPMSGSVAAEDTITSGLSLHLSQAITRTLLSEGIYAFGGKDQVEFAMTVTGDSLVKITVPSVTGASILCNDRLGLTEAVASRTTYGSRIALSAKGYPEVFDSLDVASGTTELPLVHDINPDNGEEVTAAIPFFGVSAFESAQQSDTLLIFKKRGGFLLSPQGKLAGSAGVFQELSQISGYGCESPLSVVNSQLGVFYANETGIYLISKDFQLVRIGLNLSGFRRKGTISFTDVAAVNDVDNKRIMFTAGSVTFALHLPEKTDLPIGWTRYEGFPSVMWAHRDGSGVFAASGYVGTLDTTRFADAGEIINTAVIFRSQDAGMPKVKKVCNHVAVLMSADYDHAVGEIDVSTATDFAGQFEACDPMRLTGRQSKIFDGLSDLTRPTLKMISFSPSVAKAGYYQLKVETQKLDADFEINQVIYSMALLRSRADQQASET